MRRRCNSTLNFVQHWDYVVIVTKSSLAVPSVRPPVPVGGPPVPGRHLDRVDRRGDEPVAHAHQQARQVQRVRGGGHGGAHPRKEVREAGEREREGRKEGVFQGGESNCIYKISYVNVNCADKLTESFCQAALLWQDMT